MAASIRYYYLIKKPVKAQISFTLLKTNNYGMGSRDSIKR